VELIERIVANNEISKKAYDIGLRIESVFNWAQEWNNADTFEKEETPKIIERGKNLFGNEKSLIPAPTVEEVPLPFGEVLEGKKISLYEDGQGIGVYNLFQCHRVLSVAYRKHGNKATVHLAVARWLIRNIPKARQWYIDKGYLDKAKFNEWLKNNVKEQHS